MGKKILYLIIILTSISLGTYALWNHIFELKKSAIPIKKSENPLTFRTTNGDFHFSSDKNFSFPNSDYNLITPIADTIELGIQKLGKYLSNNPDKQINILGQYTLGETNSSAFPDLGLARANTIKNYFTSQGIPSQQIGTFGSLTDTLNISNGNAVGAQRFVIAANDNQSFDELKAKLQAEPLIVYFETGESKINLSDEQRQKIANISKYLDNVTEASCIITGHSDNTGNKNKNIELGLDRADFVRAYLVENGIPTERITTDSKGPDEPITSNATAEGRAKNRRTEITIN